MFLHVMVEVLTCIDKPSSVEQVIAVPTIDFHHRVPLRTVPAVEQFVDVPVPQTALLALGTSATGVSWRQMLATGQDGMDRQPTAGYKYWARLRRDALDSGY